MPILRFSTLGLLTFAASVALASPELEQLERDLQRDAGRALVTNADGDTPLGLALKAGDHDRAQLLLRYSGWRNLRTHRNLAKEGYIYLAAQAGFADLVSEIAQEHYRSLGALGRYNFSKLDRPTIEGRRALFVAGNRAVVEALEAQHWRGFIKGPWWDFMLWRDKRGQNFVHAAARDGRADVIAYAVDRVCSPNKWENSKTWYQRYPAWVGEHGASVAQTYVTGDVGLPWDRLVNRRDVEGKTPIHVAVESRQWGALRALAHCRWADYDLKDLNGDLPLHTFLKRLDPNARQQPEDVRQAFTFLLAQSTLTRVTTLSWRLRRTNRDGNTPLHIAAHLADPYFYERLVAAGDVFALNATGNTPERIFVERRKELGVPAR